MKISHVVILGAFVVSGCQTGAASETAEAIGQDSVTGTPTAAIDADVTPGPDLISTPTSMVSAIDLQGERISMADECRRSVPRLREYLESFPLPEEMSGEEPVSVPIPGGVDAMYFFTILDELSMEPGYRLDYVLFSEWLGGKPLVYAHPSSEPAYGTFNEFMEAMGGSSSEERSLGYQEFAAEYLQHIQIDSFPAGAFQFAALMLMGDQFYLYWHALYHDELILCDDQDIDLARDAIQGYAEGLPEEVISQAEALDLEPYLIIDEDQILVRFVLFTKWGGFVEVNYLFSAGFPHELLDAEFNVLVEYDCGIMF